MPSHPLTPEFAQLALSVRQPWAELILSGRKSMEIRTWSTEYRGPVWLHTGQKRDPALEQQFGIEVPFVGGFIGQIYIASVIRLDLDRWTRWRERHLVDGPMPTDAYGWVLRDPLRFARPIRAPGELRLFYPSSAVDRELREALWEGLHTKEGPNMR
ncbi:ASCH domain-containing protein [Paraburkholderia sp. EG287B]|uniref:ASCH domain-containing protein n=1 Tax=Paraburkholderia sp. EG287B TaxID=3237010 RepID=UPI0034D36868